MSTYFTATPAGDGYSLTLVERTRVFLRSREHTLPVSAWQNAVPTEAIGLVVALFDALESAPDQAGNGQHDIRIVDEQSVFIAGAFVAGLSEHQASVADLPTLAPCSMRVDRNGPLTDPHTRLTVSWSDPDGHPLRPIRQGSTLTVAGTRFRLPLGLYRTAQAIDGFNAETSADINVRLAHLAHLKDLTGASDDTVTLEQRLDNVRLSHAQSFSLDLTEQDAGLTFDPVLHGAPDALGDSHPLLTPAEQARFSTQLFNASPDAKPSYLINDDHYLFVSPDLAPALQVVRQVQRADDSAKRDFLRSPVGYIRRALEADGALNDDTSHALEHLFIETEDYSDRVRGIGIWEIKVQPEEPPVEPPTWIAGGFGGFGGSGEGPDPEPEIHGDARYVLLPESNEDALLYIREEDGDVIKREAELPSGLVSTLRKHQLHGLAWLQWCWQRKYPGTLLADDMGVGKTIQCLAFLRWLQNTGEHVDEPIMVVAPVSLLDNWQNEIRRHLDGAGLGDLALLYGEGLRNPARLQHLARQTEARCARL